MYTIPHEQILFHKFIKFIPHVQIKELSFKIYRSYDVRSKQNVLRIAIDLSTQKKSRLLKTILRVNNLHDYSNIVFFWKKIFEIYNGYDTISIQNGSILI